MKLLISFLKEQGIEDFEADCFLVKTNGIECTECTVLDYEFIVCEVGESLWSSNTDSIEFTLIHATEESENVRLLVPAEDFSIKEIYQPNRTINVFNKDKIAFSIEENFAF